MTINQAFEILKRSSNMHDARVVLKGLCKNDKLSLADFVRVWLAAWRLRRGIPVAKIIRRKWFYGLEFETGHATLDPRPESETLIEAVLASDKKPARILDMGTGTGNLICSLVKNIPGATGIGIDISGGACRIARRNVKRLELEDRIKILKKDFAYSAFVFDVIISNPPYIAFGDKRVDSKAWHDPTVALYAGSDGLDAYRIIACSAYDALKSGGRLFLEIGQGQGNAVRNIFMKKGWYFVASKNDLSGTERVLEFCKNPIAGNGGIKK
ncbi:MAG: peptide chain release factor N(5)-glutamine methyltransferase [Alphaproteobacteria bacterium]|nr:peptide chain release factor N(5)-glutamine methyltransferase [Alphaproteobacteria bacterium]